MFASAGIVAFAVTFDPAGTLPSAWNALCQAARRVAEQGYSLRIGAGPGGEQIAAEHALTVGGRVTLVLPQSGYQEAWVAQVRRWFPGQVTVEVDEPGMDGGHGGLLRGCTFLIALGAMSRSTVGPEPFPACNRSVVAAVESAVEAGVPVFDLQGELSATWLEDALALRERPRGREGSVTNSAPEICTTERNLPGQRPAAEHPRFRRAAPLLLRRTSGSIRPGSPRPRMAE